MKTVGFNLFLLTILFLLFGWNSVNAQDKIDYSNPALIMGTSFGKFFNTLYKIGDFNKMLNFTSTQSRNKYNDSTILDQYRRMEFGYPLKLVSSQKQDQESILNYSSKIYGTTCIIRFRIRVENDSVKIILPIDFLKQKIFMYR